MKKVILFLLIFSTGVYAGVTGKLAGEIVDAETGQPLPNVNIFIPDTRFGAATGVYGEYYIIQLPPGEYTVKAEMIGYQSVSVEKVRVRVDRTTIVNFKLQPTVIELPGITVIAERPLIEHDVTASVRYASRDEIKRTPDIERSTELVRLQPGVIGSHVRGGRTSETVYYIDGIAVRHPIYGATAALDLDVMSIEEMEMLTGGFNAEYGEAQSGVVNIVTRQGSKSLSGELLYKTDNLFPKVCSFNTDYGAFALGGPVPYLPGDVRFFFSGSGSFTDTYLNNHRTRDEREFQGINYHDRQENSTTLNLKLTYDITQEHKLDFSYRRQDVRRSNFNWFWHKMPDSTVADESQNSQAVLSFRHALSENTFYTLHLGRLYTHRRTDFRGKEPPECWYWRYKWAPSEWKYEWGPIIILPDSAVIDSFVIDSIVVDTVVVDSEYIPVNDGAWGWDTDGDEFFDKGFEQYWADDSSWVWTAKFDFTSQVDPHHFLKFGAYIDYEDISYMNIQYYAYPCYSPGREVPGPWPEYGLYRWVFKHGHPWMSAAYLQDKMELPGLVVNLGTRLDYFSPGTAIFDSLYKRQWENITDMEWELQENKLFLSPRIGISHPITERTCMYFNYGRFQQVPPLQYVFRDPWMGTWIGNPNLKPQKTISYEFGFSHQIRPDIALYAKVFNKDMYDYIGMIRVGTPAVWMWVNKGYGRARGIELSLKKRYSAFTSGDFSYTYQDGTGYSSWEFMEYYRGWEWVPVRERRLDWDQRHTINASFNIEVPKGEHPVIFGVKLPDSWGINCLWRFGSGLPYTPAGRPITEVENYGDKPYTSKFDVNLHKEVTLEKADIEVFLNILNLFNRKNVDRVNEWTGEPYRYGDADGTTHEIYSWGYMQYLRNPQQFGPPRQMKLGIRLSF